MNINRMMVLLLFVLITRSIFGLTPKDVLETSLCEPEGSKELPWYKKHPVILGMGVYETNILKNYVHYIPAQSNGKSLGTIKLIGELFGWQNGEFKSTNSLGKIGGHLTLEQAGKIASIISSSKSKEKLHESLMKFCCSPGCQNRFGFNKTKMKQRFVDVIINSWLESKKDSAGNSIFPAYMPLFVFYAFVYQKAPSREALVDFFKGFFSSDKSLMMSEPFGLGGCSLVDAPSPLEFAQGEGITRKWATVHADPQKLGLKQFFTSDELEYDEEIASVAIAQNWKNVDIPTRLPASIPVPGTTSRYNDCVEDVLYKFSFLLRKHYSQKLQKTLETKSLHDCLDNKDLVANKAGHAYWNHTVLGTQVPYLIYRQVVAGETVLTASDECAICLPANSPLMPKDAPKDSLFFIENTKMLAFRADGVCNGYEVSSHMSNVIVGINHLFKLGLVFDNLDIADFWDGTFCKIYFKQLEALFGCAFVGNFERGDYQKVSFDLGDNGFVLFAKNFRHIGLVSLANVMPVRVLNGEPDEEDGMETMNNLLRYNASYMPDLVSCSYPMALFTGSWEDFDSKDSARSRFVLFAENGIGSFGPIVDQLAKEMEPV